MANSEAYHHGDLRSELVRTAAIEIERSGYEQLSLRRLAVLAGVSHNAPYRHFPSRDGLLLELALDGARWLAEAYAATEKQPPDEQLRNICRAYIRLSVERPQLFRLMFVSELVKREPYKSSWTRASEDAFRIFREAVERANPGLDPTTIEDIQLRWWSIKHGLALLAMTGRFDRFPASARTDEEHFEAVLRGLGADAKGQTPGLRAAAGR